MKSLVHYELEGLLKQGHHSVWVRLGCYSSYEAAQAAASRSSQGRTVIDSRIMPLYRDTTGGYAVELHSAHDRQTLLRPHRTTEQRPYTEYPSVPA